MKVDILPVQGIALAAFLASAGGLLWASHELWASLRLREAVPAASVRAVIVEPESTENLAAAVQSRAARAWLPIFGQPVETPTAPEAPADVQPAAPPNYVLRGLVASDNMRWAIFSVDGEDIVVREGDVMEDGAEIAEIATEGVWLQTGEDLVLVTFSQDEPVDLASVEIEPDDDEEYAEEPKVQEVQTQSLTPTELRDIILRAEADRIARGVAAPVAVDR